MKTTLSEQKIFTVVWESNVDGDFLVAVYPCDSLEVAKAKVNELKEDVLSNGHFANDDLEEDCIIEECNDEHYFIKDQTDDYYEDIYIKESNLFVKSE